MNKSSLLDSSLIYGDFTAFVDSYEERPALTDENNKIIRDAYINVILRLSNNETLIANGQLFETRWYAKRINYIMYRLNSQFNGVTHTLRTTLEYAKTHSFRISISIDPRYGYQIDFPD